MSRTMLSHHPPQHVAVSGGPVLHMGDAAPDFEALGPDGARVTLATTGTGVRVLLAVPALDDPPSAQVIRRVWDATRPSGEVTLLVASMEPPDTLARWRETSGYEDVTLLSDHESGSLGRAYGVLSEERRVLECAAFIINDRGRIAYSEYAGEATSELNDQALLLALRLVLNSPLHRPGG